jgi:hypothetical protein
MPCAIGGMFLPSCQGIYEKKQKNYLPASSKEAEI